MKAEYKALTSFLIGILISIICYLIANHKFDFIFRNMTINHIMFLIFSLIPWVVFIVCVETSGGLSTLYEETKINILCALLLAMSFLVGTGLLGILNATIFVATFFILPILLLVIFIAGEF